MSVVLVAQVRSEDLVLANGTVLRNVYFSLFDDAGVVIHSGPNGSPLKYPWVLLRPQDKAPLQKRISDKAAAREHLEKVREASRVARKVTGKVLQVFDDGILYQVGGAPGAPSEPGVPPERTSSDTPDGLNLTAAALAERDAKGAIARRETSYVSHQPWRVAMESAKAKADAEAEPIFIYCDTKKMIDGQRMSLTIFDAGRKQYTSVLNATKTVAAFALTAEDAVRIKSVAK